MTTVAFRDGVLAADSLATDDACATNGGWRSNRSMQSIVYHREHGEVGRSKVHAAMFED